MFLSHPSRIRLFSFMLLALLIPPGMAHAGDDDDYCREYTKRVVIGGKMQESYGTACLRPDGQWEIQNEGRAVPAVITPIYQSSPPPATVNYVIHDTPRAYYPPYWGASFYTSHYSQPHGWHHRYRHYDERRHRGHDHD